MLRDLLGKEKKPSQRHFLTWHPGSSSSCIPWRDCRSITLPAPTAFEELLLTQVLHPPAQPLHGTLCPTRYLVPHCHLSHCRDSHPKLQSSPATCPRVPMATQLSPSCSCLTHPGAIQLCQRSPSPGASKAAGALPCDTRTEDSTASPRQ